MEDKFLFILMDLDFDPSEEGIMQPSELAEFWRTNRDDFELWRVADSGARFNWEGITIIPVTHCDDADDAALYGRSEAFHLGHSALDTISVLIKGQ